MHLHAPITLGSSWNSGFEFRNYMESFVSWSCWWRELSTLEEAALLQDKILSIQFLLKTRIICIFTQALLHKEANHPTFIRMPDAAGPASFSPPSPSFVFNERKGSLTARANIQIFSIWVSLILIMQIPMEEKRIDIQTKNCPFRSNPLSNLWAFQFLKVI